MKQCQISRIFVFILIALTLLIFLVGCNNEKSSNQTTKIGVIASLTGAAAEQGKNWLDGAKLAAKELKENGQDVTLIIEDDQTQPSKVVSAMTKLCGVDEVLAVVGGTWDFLGEAAYPLAKRFKKLFITPTNPVEVISPDAIKSGFIYSNDFSLESMKDAVDKFIIKKNVKTIGLVYPDLPFGTQQASILKEIAVKYKLEIKLDFSFSAASLMSDTVKVASEKINSSNPDLVFSVIDYNGLDLLTKEFQAKSMSPLFITTQHLDQAFIFSKSPERYRNMYGVYPKVEDSEFNRRFIQEYRYPPKVFAAGGYDAIMFLADMLNSKDKIKTYQGLTGSYTYPNAKRQLGSGEVRIMTTDKGIFEEAKF